MPPRPATLAVPAMLQHGTGAKTQPPIGSQVSSVQRSPSSQESAAPVVHAPPAQLSSTVHASPSPQGVPSGWSPPPTQAPPDGSQRPLVWHGRRGGAHAGARPRAPARLAGVALRARVLIVAGGAVGLGAAAGITRVVADRPEERGHEALAMLLEVRGEALYLAVHVVGRLEHHEAPGECVAAPAVAGHGETRRAPRLERPARGALVSAWHECRVRRRGEVGGPEVAGRIAGEVDVH